MILPKLIKKALSHDGVVTAYIYGDFGYGKTSYALWVAYEVYRDWGKVLEYTFFEPREAVKAMEKAIRENTRIPVIIMDDAGLWLDKLTWWESDKIAFMQFFNLVRSVAAGVLFTTPSEDLPKPIRSKCAFRVSVRPISTREAEAILSPPLLEAVYSKIEKFTINNSPLALATVYKRKTLPSFMEVTRKTYYEVYPLHYPIYEEYQEIRRKTLKRVFNMWKKRLESIETRKTSYRAALITLAVEALKNGAKRSHIVKTLEGAGIPRSTAYYVLKKAIENIEE